MAELNSMRELLDGTAQEGEVPEESMINIDYDEDRVTQWTWDEERGELVRDLTIPNDRYVFRGPDPRCPVLTIMNTDPQWEIRIERDGNINIQGIDLTDASREFWNNVEGLARRSLDNG